MATEGPPPNTPAQGHSLRAAPVAPSAAAAAASDTSLVPGESSVGLGSYAPPDKLAPYSKWQAYSHAGWWSVREKVYQSLRRTHQTPSRLKAFDQCQSNGTLKERDNPNTGQHEYRLCGSSCHDRLCTPCARRRSQDISHALVSRLTADMKPMLLTLTLKAEAKQSLSELTTKLYTSFRYLRAHPVWERNVKGGAAFLEITRGKKGDHWHVHFHIVADAVYIPQAELSAAWLTITKDSFRVFIERPKADSGIGYSAKYAAKGIDYQIMSNEQWLDEAVMTLKGRRLAFCFGEWYGTSFASTLEADPLDNLEADGGRWSTVADASALFDGTIRPTPALLAFVAAHPFGKWCLATVHDTS